MAYQEPPEAQMPVMQVILQKYALTYSELATHLSISVEQVMRLAQGHGELTPKQLAELAELTSGGQPPVDQRFWARWQANYFAQRRR